MRPDLRLAVPALAAFSLLTGCLATRNQLRVATAQQQADLATERSQRMAADSALTATQDALRQELGAVKGDVQALRTDLQNMRTEFGAKITAMEDGLHFDVPVHFSFNDATVRDEDRPILERFARVVQQYYPGTKVTIEGFADPAGSTRYNLMLSQRRADAVKNWLTTQGVTVVDLATVGYGKTRLVTPKAWGDQPGADLNRRVVFVVETAAQKAIALAQPEVP